VARPRLQQRAVDGEVLAREQPARVGQVHDAGEEVGGHPAVEQALAVLGERRGVPRLVVELQADEPAEEQVVLELLDELPLAADRVEELEQQRPHELLRRHRGAACAAVEGREAGREVAQHGIDEHADRAQRVLRRDAVLPVHHREHHALPALLAPHRMLPKKSPQSRRRCPTRQPGSSAPC
jgi:hypothetical protein